MKIKFIAIVILLTEMCCGCSDWLDVKPSDRISEENTFSTIAGFKGALNGIYVELNRPDLYGKALSCELIEILAQRYAVAQENKSNYELMQFKYTDAYAQSRFTAIWKTGYNLIANINLLLKNCEDNRDVLPEGYYHLCRGEALALRGLLHFDLFRLFGPVYAQDSLLVSIPYYKEFALEVAPSLSGTSFIEAVINDLQTAEKELENDPILTYGVSGDPQDIFLQYRNLRLNYYAVQALMARVYMYAGNKPQALEYAKKVIAVQEKLFPWVDPMSIGNSVQNPDRVFSSELLFALQNLDRKTLFTSLFDGQNIKAQTLLAPRADVVDYIFWSEKSEYRYKTFLFSTVELGGVNYSVFNKYQGADSLYNQMIPMLRVSEMYMIAAEAEENAQDGMPYLNTLRNHRGLTSLHWYYLPSRLPEEWLRELYGEGQLFFYYKRTMRQSIPSAYDPYGSVSVNLTNYVVPVPDDEIRYN